jgi:hypothetical protein
MPCEPPDTSTNFAWSANQPSSQMVANLKSIHRSVNTIRIRLGHEALDVTLAYLKGKDDKSEEAQEHANSSSLALYA